MEQILIYIRQRTETKRASVDVVLCSATNSGEEELPSLFGDLAGLESSLFDTMDLQVGHV